MNLKKRNICIICIFIDFVALFMCFILTLAGSNAYLLALRLILNGIVATACTIELSVKISSKESLKSLGISALLFVLCLFNIIYIAMKVV